MFAYIKGKKTFVTPTEAYIELSSGIAYHVHISLNAYSSIENIDEVMLYTYLHVKEDAHTLYGFATREEREIFIKLISVSGIGPSTARVIVSSMTIKEIVQAVATDNHVRFSKVKGIGPKTAKKLILDLKGKLKTEMSEVDTILVSSNNSNKQEALDALVVLGFPKKQVENHIDKVVAEMGTDISSEHIIKAVLKKLS